MAKIKKIPLTQGKYAIINEEDFDLVSKYKWHFFARKYAGRDYIENGKKKKMSMHRLITNFPIGCEIDHINGNGLDNRRSNLRISTHKENICNRAFLNKNNTTGYRGVTWSKEKNKYAAQITVDYRHKCLGYFDRAIDAAKMVNGALVKYHKNFACLNKI